MVQFLYFTFYGCDVFKEFFKVYLGWMLVVVFDDHECKRGNEHFGVFCFKGVAIVTTIVTFIVIIIVIIIVTFTAVTFTAVTVLCLLDLGFFARFCFCWWCVEPYHQWGRSVCS